LNRLSHLIKEIEAEVSEGKTARPTGEKTLMTNGAEMASWRWRKRISPVSESDQKPIADPVFVSTHWSVVLRANQSDSPDALAALTELCRSYWFPLYAYARRQGCDVHTAQDLTQGFFSKLLEKNYLSVADRRRGRFRWFLLTAFKCFLANEWDRSQAQKRGGGQQIVSFDAMSAEERFRHEPEDSASADQLYDRRWATDLLDATRARLRAEYAGADKSERFNYLEAYLPGGHATLSQAAVGAALGLTEGTVKQEIFKVRRRFGEILREAVAQTVAHPDEVDDEINYLIDVVCRR
jgi:RNA polymerase sigma-70 factor (ECF subfamily)